MDPLDIKELIQSISLEMIRKNELKTILSCIDLTTLEGSDTDATVIHLCAKAEKMGVAAVCVYPTLVHTAVKALRNTPLKIASVAGGFPAGQLPLQLKLQEIEYALKQGATEIDFVISRNQFLQSNYAHTRKEVEEAKSVCGNVTLKVILEIGELESLEKISIASKLAIEGGADFIKTSTGKIVSNASLPAVGVMLIAIKEAYRLTGRKVGIKPSGGISDGLTAVTYLRLTQEILGEQWLQPALFRIGASRLVTNIQAELDKEQE